AARLTEAALTEADTARDEAAAAADRIREDAETEAAELREEAGRQAAELRRRGLSEAQELQDDAQAQIEQARQRAGEQLRQAGSVRGKAEADVQRLLVAARRDAEQVTATALAELAETQEQVAALRAEQEQLDQRRAQRQQRWWRRTLRRAAANRARLVPFLLTRAVLGAGLAYTSYKEHALAVTAGMHSALAWLLAVCLDGWVVAATRSKLQREMRIALAVMVLCQIAAILTDLHVLGVEKNADGQWRLQGWMAIPLATVVPIAIWRVHEIIDHAKGAHGEPATAAAGPAGPAGQPDGAHDGPAPRPSHGGQPLPTAHGELIPAQSVYVPRSPEREITAGGGTSSAHRALTGTHPQDTDAHPTETLSGPALTYARRATVRQLYTTLDRRPLVSEIHAALTAKRLITGDEKTTRSTCQRLRADVEKAEPALAPAVRSA
ncbi:ATP synthase F0 subunit B, partial [Kitasatospora sp. NPDC058060]|uniref:ATP synthase F0 subunit B n=1 Tax=Kitasatospora sp. NPDC058060 TaxID=3346318 RepID=UPI0036ED6B74